MIHTRLDVAGLLLLLIAGCGGGSDKWTEKRPAVAPADGILLYQGKPVEGATVFLAPDPPGEGKYGASAITDASGKFQLSAFPPDLGAVPGNYKVGVSKVQASAPAGGADHDQPRSAPPPKSLIPEKYGKPETSGVTLEVPQAGKTDMKIELQ